MHELADKEGPLIPEHSAERSEQTAGALAAADARLRDWNLRCGTWYIYHYVAGILGVILNVVIAGFAKLKADNLDWLFWVALVAAGLQGITTFMAARKKAAAYRAGWRTLWHARELLSTGVDPDPSKVFVAIKQGWRLISEGDQD